jgi:anti-sigma factor RsiW
VSFLRPRRRDDAPGDEPTELAALADGSLPAERRAALEARLAESPPLAAELVEQKRAVEVVRRASASTAAPARLRARVEAERRPRVRRPGRRLVLGTGFATAAAAAAVLLLVLPGGAGGPSLASAAALSARPAVAPAPLSQPGEPKLLARAVGGVPFPNWREKFGWRASGQRADTLAGRRTATVFYRKQGDRIGYTIVDGAPLSVPQEADTTRREGTELHTFVSDGRLVVTWLRGGRTCVLTGTGVPRDVLLKLAAWKGKGAVPF